MARSARCVSAIRAETSSHVVVCVLLLVFLHSEGVRFGFVPEKSLNRPELSSGSRLEELAVSGKSIGQTFVSIQRAIEAITKNMNSKLSNERQRGLQSLQNLASVQADIMQKLDATEDAKRDAAKSIRLLLFDDNVQQAFNKDQEMLAKVLKGLCTLMQEGNKPTAQTEAAYALYNFGEAAEEELVQKFGQQFLEPLKGLIDAKPNKDEDRDVQAAAAGVLFTFLHGYPERVDTIERVRKTTFVESKLVDSLVNMLSSGTKEAQEGAPRGQEYAAMALLSLAGNERVARDLIQKGEPQVLPAVLALFEGGSKDGQEYAAMLLSELHDKSSSNKAAFQQLQDQLFSTSHNFLTAAASVLNFGSEDGKKETRDLMSRVKKMRELDDRFQDIP